MCVVVGDGVLSVGVIECCVWVEDGRVRSRRALVFRRRDVDDVGCKRGDGCYCE